ncbi:DUF3024 domain-containing protein [Chitinophagaceae bacterium LB-8]|uniref:DUF3024 domain-containing protein n=1 Tax=Paraflavisolibacter caeni TaxID=2982496 RepID=A0A9X2XNX1_9BACT|nr:DUF3024 domain-containing protein [Paraflavisolibacter caeni]MCU7549868.1 DUF3024 domain-containing protein [Paraflavisolibacter caeni]
MAFSPNQVKEITSMMGTLMQQMRPPEHIRHQLDLGWKVERQSVFLFEIRPRWDDPSIIEKYDFAKATWVQKEKEWHVYWMRANGKWDRYAPLKSVVNLQRFIIEIERDLYGCFRG